MPDNSIELSVIHYSDGEITIQDESGRDMTVERDETSPNYTTPLQRLLRGVEAIHCGRSRSTIQDSQELYNFSIEKVQEPPYFSAYPPPKPELTATLNHSHSDQPKPF